MSTRTDSGSHRAIVVRSAHDGAVAAIEQREAPQAGLGELVLDVQHSSVNFKDALAMSGRPGVLRSHPMVPGIDAVGTVVNSDDPHWPSGQTVILNGAGIGERADGGLAERVVVPADSAVRLPSGWSTRSAAAVGTAGFTAALSVLALRRDVSADAGDVLVTGAAGGVGSFAIRLLSSLGYRVVASTGRPDDQGDRLRELGAADVIHRGELSDSGGKPMQKARWAGAVDSVGSTTLVSVLAQTSYGGVVTACGLAQGPDLPGTVLPFILRGVSLLGINSVDAPHEKRAEAWQLIADTLDEAAVTSIAPQTIGLEEAIGLAPDVLAGKVAGRVVVDVAR
ncbi:MDR family oxidoreductase [Naasia lichenicola]|uniref:Oxidoreductase n=1 Tax=Naasia lichenicola TaxID=2565933 RepID=A0A4S4FHW9_9MICO|nr:MDR family oxidoreductase [Naasia lichenicola]THG29424.1 oxidoreductase [Naasia lichenicola]